MENLLIIAIACGCSVLASLLLTYLLLWRLKAQYALLEERTRTFQKTTASELGVQAKADLKARKEAALNALVLSIQSGKGLVEAAKEVAPQYMDVLPSMIKDFTSGK